VPCEIGNEGVRVLDILEKESYAYATREEAEAQYEVWLAYARTRPAKPDMEDIDSISLRASIMRTWELDCEKWRKNCPHPHTLFQYYDIVEVPYKGEVIVRLPVKEPK
jgi:hypothetical protein